MRAGQLRNFVTIEQPTETRNAIGEMPPSSWPAFATWWAKKIVRGGAETDRDGQRYGTAVVEWEGRYIAGVTTKMRLRDAAGTLFLVALADETRKAEGVMVLITLQQAAGTT